MVGGDAQQYQLAPRVGYGHLTNKQTNAEGGKIWVTGRGYLYTVFSQSQLVPLPFWFLLPSAYVLSRGAIVNRTIL